VIERHCGQTLAGAERPQPPGEAEQNQTQLRMRVPFEPSLDGREPKFYAMPQPALPPKDQHSEPPRVYEQARREPEPEI
jgi:hypothetical protein